ncbi:MAG TPA: hypothetical protein VHO00_08570 [Actinomycetes bacterium]|jgi:hypothetical protein|nr:hypothetical protein [Actinomycetes bacterium]
MFWRDRRVLLALGATAVMGLLFGMILATLTSGGDGSSQAGQAVNTGTSNPSESESAASSAPASPPPTDLRNPDYGYLTVVRTGDQTVLVFDRVDFLTGEEARQRWEEDGGEPLDYYISNVNKRLRDRVVAADVKVFGSQRLTGAPPEQEIEPDQLFGYVNSGDGTDMLVRLRYNKETGEVIEIKEVYLP